MTASLRLFLDMVLALVAPRAVLVAENILLRRQFIVVRCRVNRPRFRSFDRWLISALAGYFRGLRGVVLLVNPETVIRWHGAGWRLFWRRQSRRQPGRPPIDADLRVLIRRMWRDNSTWGEDRVAGKLAKLGYRVCPRTVAKYRPAGLSYHYGRPHRGLQMQPPDGARHLAPKRPTRGTRITTTPILGGLHHHYGFMSPGSVPTEQNAGPMGVLRRGGVMEDGLIVNDGGVDQADDRQATSGNNLL
jgi:hypothetical protein